MFTATMNRLFTLWPCSPARVVEIVDRAGHAFADAGHALEVLQRGGTDLSGSAEMEQQRPLARRANAGNLIQRRGRDGTASFLPVRADYVAVRLVAQALEIEQYR